MSSRTITVVGVGYIGSVIALYLAEQGHDVTGIDTDSGVLDAEAWFDRYDDIAQEADDAAVNRIETSTSYQDVDGDVSIVCVDTPVRDGTPDLSNIRSALRDLAAVIQPGHTIVLRSTLTPGTTRDELIPLIADVSGMEPGEGFHICYAPEFMRGGAGMADLTDPSKTVVAGDAAATETFIDLFPVSDNLHETSIATAEAVKCFDNVFHGLKVSLANESGRLGAELGFDPRDVMDILSSDQKLNVSDAYMRPGAPFGGPCLSKDITMLNHAAEPADTDTPVLSAINESNTAHTDWIVDMVASRGAGTVGLVGASYKEGFNSLANSPCIAVASRLKERGHEVLIHDPRADIDGFAQADLDALQADTDIWVVFNAVPALDTAAADFEGDIIDLSDFTFPTSG